MLFIKIYYMINILFLGDNCVYIKFNLNVFGEI